MDKRMLTPGEVATAMVNVGIKKVGLATNACILLGILAGIFIGLGGLGNILIGQTFSSIDPGLGRFVGAIIFPIGLMLVVICGAELFTGNCLMTLAVMEKKITMGQMFKNWGIVYVTNFIGSVLLVLVVFYAGTLSGDAVTKTVGIAEAKAGLTVSQAFLRAILCNILVVLAVWMATAGKDVISKIFACWFPVMLFVLCGFEHSIANMFFLPMGMILGAKVTMAQLITNLVVVTLGNIVGGAIIIPFVYHNCYLKSDKVKATN
jgi:formate/nitrite transporter